VSAAAVMHVFRCPRLHSIMSFYMSSRGPVDQALEWSVVAFTTLLRR
jgi:hypothetical protein